METKNQQLPTTALSRGPTADFAELAARYLEEYLDKIRLAAGSLSQDALWRRPSPGTNSVGNLLIHLSGNLELWIVFGLADQPVTRDRSAEFAAASGADFATTFGELAKTVERCTTIIRSSHDWSEQITVQGYDLDRQGALFHAVEHMSYHTGQVVYLVKQANEAGTDLEFYPQHRDE